MLKWKVIFLAAILTGCTTSQTAHISQLPEPLTVHLVVSLNPETQIEKVFRTQQEALDYIEYYRGAHDYYYQPLVLP